MAEEKVPERSFQPVTEQDINKPESPEAPGQPAKRPVSRGIPKAHVNPDMVREFEEEVTTKVTTGRKRMRMFANHFILFTVGIAVAVGLKMTIYADLENAFFLVPFVAWVGLLAIHANHALKPILKLSKQESQTTAGVPPSRHTGNG